MRSDDLKFPFGKYRDQPFFDVVSTSDPSYWVWVLTQQSLATPPRDPRLDMDDARAVSHILSRQWPSRTSQAGEE